MNVIEKVKEIINQFPALSDFTDGVELDFTANKIGDFGLYSTGDSLVKRDVVGTQHRRHSFALYATNQSFNAFERLENSSFLLDLGYWLDGREGEAVEAVIDGVTRSGVIEKMSASNAMVFSVPTGDMKDGVTYQIQIYADYILKGE